MPFLEVDIHLRQDEGSEPQRLLHMEYSLPDGVTSVEAVEQYVHRQGFDLMRHLLAALLEAQEGLWAQRRQHRDATCRVTNEGHRRLRLKTIVGEVELRRHRQYCHTHQEWFLPFNQAQGLDMGNVYLTQGLRELATRAVLTMPYEPATTWVDGFTRSRHLLCPKEVQRLVIAQGQDVRRREKERAQQLQQAEIRQIQNRIRRQAPPPARTGVFYLAVDGIMVRRQPGSQQWLTGYAGVLFTPAKERVRKGRFRLTEKRYVSTFAGVAEFGQLLQGAARHLQWDRYAEIRWLIDGAWELVALAQNHSPGDGRMVIRLDWFHLAKKVKQRLATAYPDRTQRRVPLRMINKLLWHGQGRVAWGLVQALRPDPHSGAPGVEALEKLSLYLERNLPYLGDYAAEQQAGYMISSAQGEKACDVLIAKRQKKEQGMHWGTPGADAVAALRSLFFNGEWEAYWEPLIAAL
jgi:hypothetical protein